MKRIDTVFVVGAGFSSHAGLPLTSKFTEAILEARGFGHGPSRIMVDYLSKFINETFDHSVKAGARFWPDLEDIFTCVDLSANTGHHLGGAFGPSDLRTVRRATLCRIIRMLDQKYQEARKVKDKNQDSDWRRLDAFFSQLDLERVGFISMNWDTVIERKIQLDPPQLPVDYRCNAIHAGMPDELEASEFKSHAAFLKKVREGQPVLLAPVPKAGTRPTPVIKIHGSANWLYCDNCRRLFWFHPDESRRIADQLIREDDLRRIAGILRKKSTYIDRSIETLRQRPEIRCVCSNSVPLGTRIATFSYRKALDFPMFQKSWFAAEELLRAANKWVFIGYSLPAADYEFKYMLKRIQLSRKKQPEFVVVSGGSGRDIRRTFDNYHKFFGRSVKNPTFFSSGLTQEAVKALCSQGG